MPERINYSLIGIPDHQGVLPVGGRIGAQEGPRAFRKQLAKFSGREDIKHALVDAGDAVADPSDLSRTLENAAAKTAELHARPRCRSVIVGGSHEHGYSQLRGVRLALQKRTPTLRLGCINVDAHLDVRKPSPWITSGSPFYLAIENGVLDPEYFVEFGIQSHCNAPELWEYAEQKRLRVIPWEGLRHGKALGAFESELDRLSALCDAIVISFDLDAIAQAFAPGVSAPQAEGLSASEAIEMAELAGARAKVVSLGIFELNPAHDEGERTARLAASLAYHFVSHALKSEFSS